MTRSDPEIKGQFHLISSGKEKWIKIGKLTLSTMNSRSQKEPSDLKMAIADVNELMEFSKYLPDSPSDVISKLISRSSNSTCANLIEVVLFNKEVESE